MINNKQQVKLQLAPLKLEIRKNDAHYYHYYLTFPEMLVNELRDKTNIESIINKKWKNCSTNKRPKLTKVERFSLVYQQEEADLKDKDTNLALEQGQWECQFTEPDYSKNYLRIRGKEQDSAPGKRGWQG